MSRRRNAIYLCVTHFRICHVLRVHMTWPKGVYALRCSFWNFRPGEPELFRVLGDMGWRAPCFPMSQMLPFPVFARQGGKG